MKFGSWTYNGFKVNFMLQQDTGDTSTFIPNGEWALIGQYHRSRATNDPSEKAPTWALSWLKAPTLGFAFKTH